MTYYNDSDAKVCEWAKELIKEGVVPYGDVDKRSIIDVKADDLRGYSQCHFFSGILGWPYALRLAGWPADRPVWTGSCPCQPYSAAGKRKGHKDERDLWPTFFNLIKEVRPPVIFGEQVASSDVIGSSVEAAFVDAVQRGDYARANKLAKRVVTQPAFHAHPRWLTRVRTDMEGIGYTVRWKILGAHSVLSPHIRQRLYWVADAGQLASRDANPGKDFRESYQPQDWRGKANDDVAGRFGFGRLANADVTRPLPATHRGIHSGEKSTGPRDVELKRRSRDSRLGDPDNAGLERRGERGQRSDELLAGTPISPWSDSILIPCRDGKARRLKPGLEPLVDGLPGRVALLRGAGNAIVPQVAAAFIRAFLETESGVIP